MVNVKALPLKTSMQECTTQQCLSIKQLRWEMDFIWHILCVLQPLSYYVKELTICCLLKLLFLYTCHIFSFSPSLVFWSYNWRDVYWNCYAYRMGTVTEGLFLSLPTPFPSTVVYYIGKDAVTKSFTCIYQTVCDSSTDISQVAVYSYMNVILPSSLV